MFWLASLLGTAQAGDFLDVWVTTAFEDTNLFAGPELYSPSANFVQRGNTTFFENYERRVTDDISRANLVLYNASNGYHKGWSTESAFVLRYTPYLNPDMTQPGTNIRDDGSYVRIIRELPGEKHNISLTGYAVDSGRFRLGYSYDLTWGSRSIFSFDPGAVPGVRLQWQKGGAYSFLGVKSAMGDYITEDLEPRNQAYYGYLAGAGIKLANKLKLEGGLGLFEQDQIKNVQSTDNSLYGEIIGAMGYCAQVSYRTRDDLGFIQSADLKLYRNQPDMVKKSYIKHRQLDGFGALFQSEINYLQHNLLDPNATESTTVETGIAADVQSLVVYNTTQIGVDLVYKNLEYILFNVPGLTSGVAMDPAMEKTAQFYGRFNMSHYIPTRHLTPSLGIGWMQPATYKTEGGTFVQYTAYDKEQVPEDQEPTPILSAIAGLQVDMSDSTVLSGELLYTVDNNLSDFVQDEDGLGGKRVAAPKNERQALGMNLVMRSRF
jgi:hypothetical protein